MTLIAPVGLPSADGTPPHVAQVPIAIVAAAPGASRAQPRRGRHGLAMLVAVDGLDAHGGEVAARALGDALVGDRALEDDDVRLAFELAVPRVLERLHEVGAGLDRQHRVMQHHLRHRRHRASSRPSMPGLVAPATAIVQPSQLIPASQ